MKKTNKKQQQIEIGNRLKEARIEAGYESGRSFALTNAIPQTTLWQHEKGRREISLVQAHRYCSLLEVDLYWLVAGENRLINLSAMRAYT